ncbi:MAG TPA: amidase family protein [Acidimicrobiales bacterium]|nr:amidase family protein [Acidimicrobiales bacterium]
MPDPHGASADLASLGALEAAAAMAAGELTSERLVDALTERVAALDSPDSPTALRSIAALAGDAFDVAGQRDAERLTGTLRGPLHGIPVVVKDNVEAAGLGGWAGSSALVGRPVREAPLVSRLRGAGAVVLASSNLSQWANIRSTRSTSGWSATGGLVANPWALDRSAGGSSSGSGAALAAGLAPIAVGTETDGSITCPASLNGVVGLKPTVGSVSTEGVVPISSSQDSPGPMARSVADVAALFSVLSGRDPEPVAEVRLVDAATYRTGHAATDALCDAVVAELGRAGASVTRRDVAEPSPEVHSDELTVLLAELVDDLSAYLAARPGEGVRSLADVVAFEDEHRDVEQPFFGHEHFLAALDTGGRAGERYPEARRRNLAWALETCLTPALDGADVLVAPSYGPAWKSDLTNGDSGTASPVTCPAAIAGWPIACVPVGLVDGLPVGLAIVGRPQSEWALLDVAARVERIVGSLGAPMWRAPSRG